MFPNNNNCSKPSDKLTKMIWMVKVSKMQMGLLEERVALMETMEVRIKVKDR